MGQSLIAVTFLGSFYIPSILIISPKNFIFLIANLLFLNIYLQTSIVESFKYLYNIRFILQQILRIYKDIIKVGYIEISKQSIQNLINIALEYRWAIIETKRQNTIFIVTISHTKSSQVLSLLIKSNTIEGLVDIKLYKYLYAS